MLLLLFSLCFFGLAVKEVFRKKLVDPLDIPFLSVMLILGIACAWSPVRTWFFEKYLEENAYLLSLNSQVSVHCNTALDSIFDNQLNVAGHANPRTGKIVFQIPWCDHIRNYIKNPHAANEQEKFSLVLFAHEAMHIRGELNEELTDCQAIQRLIRTAKLFDVPEYLAIQHANHYYKKVYPRHPYFSANCVPGSEWDEKLVDSYFNHLEQD